MNEEFDIFKFLNPKPSWLGRSGSSYAPVVPPWLGQDRDDQPALGLTNDSVLHRHYPSLNAVGRITIRQVRKVTLGPDFTDGLGLDRPDDEEPKVMVRAIRPFSRRSQTTCYWKDAGWEERGEWLIGHYRAGRRFYPGSVERRGGSYEPFKFYIYNPPDEILNGPHGICFHPRGKADLNRYWIHFSDQPVDVDSGIIQVEHDLREALEIR